MHIVFRLDFSVSIFILNNPFTLRGFKKTDYLCTTESTLASIIHVTPVTKAKSKHGMLKTWKKQENMRVVGNKNPIT